MLDFLIFFLFVLLVIGVEIGMNGFRTSPKRKRNENRRWWLKNIQ